MNDLDALKRFRDDLPGPTDDAVARSRERLLAAIGAHANGTRPTGPWRRIPRTGLAVAITALIALPSGFALGRAIEGDEVSPGGFLEPSACPEATAAFDAAGLSGFSESFVASEGCPSERRVNEIIRAVQRDAVLREEAEARGLFPDSD